MSNNQTIRRTLILMLGVALGIISLSTSAFGAPSGKSKAAGHDPSGNNGTIKIDGAPFDDAPDNEPHVGCEFEIDFYGFDRDPAVDAADRTYFSKVSFEGIAPTGGGNLVPDKGSTSVFVGEDAAGGGTDLDASELFSLRTALSGVAPHPKQGYHVKVTVHTPFSRGADVKHKVLWIAPCAPLAPAEQVAGETKEETKQQETKQEIQQEAKEESKQAKEERTEIKAEVLSAVASRTGQVQPAPVSAPPVNAAQVVTEAQTPSAVLSVAAESAPAREAGRSAEVLGVEFTRGAAAGQLAVTGGNPRILLLLAGIALCLGLSFVSGSKLLARG